MAPLALLMGAILALAAAPAAAGVPIARGDTLSITVVEEPTLDGEVTVDLDGRIALPGIGGLEVAGLDVAGVRARIEAALRGEGLVREPSVRVEVARHRPFYVGGDVRTPGAFEFEAGLTVRHALVLAGGPARPRDAAGPSLAELAGLRAQLRASGHELYAVEARIARLEGEMAGRADAELPDPGAGPRAGVVPAEAADAIRALEEGLLEDRMTEWEGQQRHLRTVLDLLDLEIDLLARRAENQEAEQGSQRADLADARDLVDRGLAPLSRVKELEREASRVERDLLENQTFAARARQAKATAEHEIEAAEVSRRVELRGALEEARGERVRLEAQMEALSAGLLAAGLGIGEDPSAALVPEVTIYRPLEGEEEIIPARMTTEILPGDVVDVALAEAPAG